MLGTKPLDKIIAKVPRAVHSQLHRQKPARAAWRGQKHGSHRDLLFVMGKSHWSSHDSGWIMISIIGSWFGVKFSLPKPHLRYLLCGNQTWQW